MNRSDLLDKTLILLNEKGIGLDREMCALQQVGVTLHSVDYGQLESEFDRIVELCDACRFLLFAQNDQVLDKKSIGNIIKALHVGYSSFSGIDDDLYLAQTRQCLTDFIAGQAKLDLPSGSVLHSTWQPGELGFSLVFDTEQMGGVRFGLPRILDLLEFHQTPATFFVTGFVASAYSDLLKTLADRGHCVGIHGAYHEYPSTDLDTQIKQFIVQKEALGQYVEVKGANFINRMNQNTVEALATCGFDYFVVQMSHLYFPFTYQQMPVQPFRIWMPNRSIWMVPISSETYNHPWIIIRAAIASAVRRARWEQAPSVGVLTHPFEIGALRHIGILGKLLKCLKINQSLSPTTLDSVVEHLPVLKPSVYIYVVLGRGDMCGARGFPKKGELSRWWWYTSNMYWQRVGIVYVALQKLGYHPALCFSWPSDGPVFAVYPHIPKVSTKVLTLAFDPIAHIQSSPELLSVLSQCIKDMGNKLIIFKSSGGASDLNNAMKALRPKRIADCLGVLSDFTVRLILKLCDYRHVF